MAGTAHCTWREDADGVWWACEENAWSFDVGGKPYEHGMKFCPFCGKPLAQQPYVEPEWEEEAGVEQ
ncbi:MAG TPA: hypothetical protein VF202_02225 [Trueperaceae bacterium]